MLSIHLQSQLEIMTFLLYDVIWEFFFIIRRKSLLSGLFAYGSPNPGSPGPFPTSPSTFETGFEQLASCACQPSKKKKEKITGSLFFSLFCKNASPTKNDQTWPGLRPEWIKLPYTTVDHHKTSYNIIYHHIPLYNIIQHHTTSYGKIFIFMGRRWWNGKKKNYVCL